MKTVYLAGAIHHVSPEEAIGWRKVAREALEAAGFKVFDPTDGKNLGIPGINTTYYTPAEIVEKDKAMIDRSDYVLMEIARTVIPYHGTSMECLYAWERGKPVIVWGGCRSYWVRYHATKIFDDLESALAELIKGMEG